MISRSLVGSSKISIFGAEMRVCKRASLLLSPPESFSIFVYCIAPSKRKRSSILLADMVPSFVCTYSAMSFADSITVWLGSSSPESCEKYPILAVCPMIIFPLSGATSPKIVLRRVDFPEPFLPMIPILSILLKRYVKSVNKVLSP